MVTADEIARRKLLKNNPLITKGLGDLIKEIQQLVAENPFVLQDEKLVPPNSIETYKLYQLYISEINKRELEYREKPIIAPRIGAQS